MDFLKKHAYLIVAGILSFHFILSLVISSQESMIYDERAHIPAAYSYVRFGDMRLNPEHPPLLKDLAGLPLLALNLSFPLNSDEWKNGANEQWSVGDMFVNCARPDMGCNSSDAILFWSRLPIILIAVILGIALFLWTRELRGTLAGLLAVTLYAFDPNIIAHNHYVTTDIGIAAFLFFAFYFFVRFLKNPNYKNVLWAGIFLGLAELTKFSAVLLFPIFGLFILLYAITKQKPANDTRSTFAFRWSVILEYSFKYIGIILVCFVVIWSLYAVNISHMPREKVVALADLFLSQPNVPAQITHSIIVQMSAPPLLRPFAEYFVGVAKVFSRFESGNVYYYFGTVTTEASKSYFPMVFLLKETLVFLFLIVATSLYALYRIIKGLKEKTTSLWAVFSHSFQNNIVQYISVFFILFYSFISITGNLNIGFRHLFPILPFLYMLVAKTIFDFFRRHDHDKTTKKVLTTLLGGLILSAIAIPILAYPNYLSYFNVAGGGHSNGYKYVTDSNYDWGQDLKRLRNFVDQYNLCVGQLTKSPECLELINAQKNNIATQYPSGFEPIEKIRVDYFGGANPATLLKDQFIPWWDQREPESGWYAISAFFYQESLYKEKPAGARSYAWLQNIQPIARAGDSIFIYYIPENR
jgi:hypothetical protein